MPTPVSATSPTPISDLGSAGPASKPSRPDELGKDAFLKLLVAQLKYQDPTNPVDSAQFMSQTAQFTQVEKLEEIARSTTQMLGAQSMLATSALVGRTVTYIGSDGAEANGLVTSATFGPDGATVRLADGTDLPIDAVTEVRATPSGT